MIAKAFQEEGNIECIIAVDVSKKALDKALTLGADHVVNADSLGMKEDAIRNMVMKFTNGLGADLTIDAAGFASTCENAVHMNYWDLTGRLGGGQGERLGGREQRSARQTNQ